MGDALHIALGLLIAFALCGGIIGYCAFAASRASTKSRESLDSGFSASGDSGSTINTTHCSDADGGCDG